MQILKKKPSNFRYRYMLLHCVLCEVVGTMWHPAAGTKRLGGGGHTVTNLASQSLKKCKIFKELSFSLLIHVTALCRRNVAAHPRYQTFWGRRAAGSTVNIL